MCTNRLDGPVAIRTIGKFFVVVVGTYTCFGFFDAGDGASSCVGFRCTLLALSSTSSRVVTPNPQGSIGSSAAASTIKALHDRHFIFVATNRMSARTWRISWADWGGYTGVTERKLYT